MTHDISFSQHWSIHIGPIRLELCVWFLRPNHWQLQMLWLTDLMGELLSLHQRMHSQWTAVLRESCIQEFPPGASHAIIHIYINLGPSIWRSRFWEQKRGYCWSSFPDFAPRLFYLRALTMHIYYFPTLNPSLSPSFLVHKTSRDFYSEFINTKAIPLACLAHHLIHIDANIQKRKKLAAFYFWTLAYIIILSE